MLESKLKEFRRIDSEPTYVKPVGDDHILWVGRSLSFLEDKKEWLIAVPKCTVPVWANVRVLNYFIAIEEIWNTSESNSFLMAD